MANARCAKKYAPTAENSAAFCMASPTPDSARYANRSPKPSPNPVSTVKPE